MGVFIGPRPIRGMYVIEYDGRPAAFVTANDIRFADWVTQPENYVIGRWVCCEAVFAHEIASGHVAGPFTERRADEFARIALMPDAEFAELDHVEDHLIAGHFDVPIEQVAAKRAERVGTTTD
jgi:hypothetical protein